MVKSIKCDNSSLGSYTLVHPGCNEKFATKMVKVHYDEYSDFDTFHLCDECVKTLKKDARKYGYKIRTRNI